jgi:hypothetical protein
MLKLILIATATMLAACATINADGSGEISCLNILFCKMRVSSYVEESKRKWEQLNLRDYSYIFEHRYFDEPPKYNECRDKVKVNVKNNVVISVESVSCNTEKEKLATQKNLKYMKTMDDMYKDCQEKVLNNVPSYVRLVFSFDKKGIIESCYYSGSHYGEHTGGKILYKN